LSNYNLELEFAEDRASKIAFPSVARIYIHTSTRNDATGLQYISLDCMTEKELDSEVDRLIAELEMIRNEGRKKFAEDDKRRRERHAEPLSS
jgi:hypothetical protein